MLFVIDSRHPVLHFPPSLFQYIVHDLKKKLVLVFNKVQFSKSKDTSNRFVYNHWAASDRPHRASSFGGMAHILYPSLSRAFDGRFLVLSKGRLFDIRIRKR